MTVTLPLLKIGNFGTHIIKNPAGTYSFVGTVPADLNDTVFENYDDAVASFVDFFISLPADVQGKYHDALRDDIQNLIAGKKEAAQMKNLKQKVDALGMVEPQGGAYVWTGAALAEELNDEKYLKAPYWLSTDNGVGPVPLDDPGEWIEY